MINGWIVGDSTIRNFEEPLGADICYGFDLDDTLICSKSGADRSSTSDWRYMYPSVPAVLGDLKDRCVIFTNQRGLKSPEKVGEWIAKMDVIFKDLGFRIRTIASLVNDQCRKPGIKLIYEAIKDPLWCRFIYVGDAYIEKYGNGPSDLEFARNVSKETFNAVFWKPEMFFADHRYEKKKGRSILDSDVASIKFANGKPETYYVIKGRTKKISAIVSAAMTIFSILVLYVCWTTLS